MKVPLQAWMVPGILLGTMVYAIAEDVTYTTFYPSPRGVYQALRVGDGTTPAVDANLYVKNTPPNPLAVLIDGIAGTAVAITQNGDMGFGTVSPACRLDLGGGHICGIGPVTVNNPLNVVGNFTVNTTQLTVNAANGNTRIAGDLTVMGNTTLNGTTTTNGPLVINGPLTASTGTFNQVNTQVLNAGTGTVTNQLTVQNGPLVSNGTSQLNVANVTTATIQDLTVTGTATLPNGTQTLRAWTIRQNGSQGWDEPYAVYAP